MAAFNAGAEAFIVANGLKVRPVKVISVSGGLYTLMFRDGPGATRLKEGRLYRTEKDAEGSIKTKIPESRRLKNPHTMGYQI